LAVVFAHNARVPFLQDSFCPPAWQAVVRPGWPGLSKSSA